MQIWDNWGKCLQWKIASYNWNWIWDNVQWHQSRSPATECEQYQMQVLFTRIKIKCKNLGGMNGNHTELSYIQCNYYKQSNKNSTKEMLNRS